MHDLSKFEKVQFVLIPKEKSHFLKKKSYHIVELYRQHSQSKLYDHLKL